MKYRILIPILIIISLTSFIGCTSNYNSKISLNINNKPHMLKLISPAYNENDGIPAKYTCDGENINPPLEILDIPENAKSLVLIFDDPDAPRGIWTHWIIYNINPQTTAIAENSVPVNSRLINNDFGNKNYGAPCPPSGTHRYIFHLYALDTVLDLPDNADLGSLQSAMGGHVIDSAELTGKYQRK